MSYEFEEDQEVMTKFPLSSTKIDHVSLCASDPFQFAEDINVIKEPG